MGARKWAMTAAAGPRRGGRAAGLIAGLMLLAGLGLVVVGLVASRPTEVWRSGGSAAGRLWWAAHRPDAHALEVTWVERPEFPQYATRGAETLAVEPAGATHAREAWVAHTVSGRGRVYVRREDGGGGPPGGTAVVTFRTLRVRLWPVGAILTIVGGAWLVVRAVRQYQAAERAATARFCTQCGYDLRATPRDGPAHLARCPECGTPAPPKPKWPWAAGKWGR